MGKGGSLAPDAREREIYTILMSNIESSPPSPEARKENVQTGPEYTVVGKRGDRGVFFTSSSPSLIAGC